MNTRSLRYLAALVPLTLLCSSTVAGADTNAGPARASQPIIDCTETRQITFDIGSTAMNATDERVLNEVATCMRKHPRLKYFVIGEAGPIGGDTHNWILGYERANKAVDALTELGIPRYRLAPMSGGKGKSVFDRRVVFAAVSDQRLRQATLGGYR
jgi:outer membrane protein OmpA-like peptidoglycan-associated protein